MRIKNALLAGSLTMIVITAVLHTSDTFAHHGQPADLSDRIGHGGSTYSFDTKDGAADCQFTAEKATRVDVIERIGHGGSTYSVIRVTPNEPRDCHAGDHRVTNQNRVGHGGSTYSSGETMTN